MSSECESGVVCPAGRRVLVVDDTDDCAGSLALLLEFNGHEVCVAHGALEAVELAERFRPAVIFMDIGLPVIDGFEAIRRIRAQRWGRDIVLCALTMSERNRMCVTFMVLLFFAVNQLTGSRHRPATMPRAFRRR